MSVVARYIPPSTNPSVERYGRGSHMVTEQHQELIATRDRRYGLMNKLTTQIPIYKLWASGSKLTNYQMTYITHTPPQSKILADRMTYANAFYGCFSQGSIYSFTL